MTDRTVIGQKIAELRKEKGMTQAELAEALGVTHQAVSQWERSETFPDILTLPKIAEIFGESINALLGVEAAEEKPADTVIVEDGGQEVKETEETVDDDEPEPTIEDVGDSYQIHIPPITIPGIPAIELPLINIPKVGQDAGAHNSEIAERLRESQENARRQAEMIREEARRSAETAKKQAEAIRAEALQSAETARRQAAAMGASSGTASRKSEEDDLFDKAVALAVEKGKITTSLLQRHLMIGYSQASRLIDQMEARGYIGPQNGLGPREVLVTAEDLEKTGFADFYEEMAKRAEDHKAEFEKIARNFEKDHAAEIEEITRNFEKEHAAEIEESARKYEEEHAAGTTSVPNDANVRLGGLEDFSLPVSEMTYDFGGAEGAYEIAFVRDGKIIAVFQGDPDRHVTLNVYGVGGSLKSELSVTVNGDVCGTATSGLGMTVNGDVNGDAHAGLELNCGDVAGDAQAGLGITCGAITGNANAGMGITCASHGEDDRTFDDEGIRFSPDGKNITIEGDYDGDLTGAASVTVNGDVNGDVSSEGPTAIGGDVGGDVSANGGLAVGGDVSGNAVSAGAMTVNGDVSGDVNGGEVTVKGDVDGDATSGGAMTVEGVISGDASSGTDMNVEGDIEGDVSCSGNLTVHGDIEGDVEANNASWNAGGSAEISMDGKNVTITGSYDGDLSGANHVSVSGDVNGSVDAGNSVTVEGSVGDHIEAGGNVQVGGSVDGGIDAGGRVNVGGNVDGDIEAGGNVQVDGDVTGSIEAERVNVKGDYHKTED